MERCKNRFCVAEFKMGFAACTAFPASGHYTFENLGASLCFGTGFDEIEANEVVSIIYKRFPQYIYRPKGKS